MAFDIYTTGIRYNENKKNGVALEAQLNILQTKNIKIFVDTRSITNYATYSEKDYYNPINLNKILKEKEVDYYNIGDLFKCLNMTAKKLDKKSSRVELTNKFYSDLNILIENLGNAYGNVCVLFTFGYCFGDRGRRITWRGSYSKNMSILSSHEHIFHYVPFVSGRTFYSNKELYNEAYGELITIKEDIEDKKCTIYDDDYDSWNNNAPSGYTSEELDDMYRDAFNGNPDAQWNID